MRKLFRSSAKGDNLNLNRNYWMGEKQLPNFAIRGFYCARFIFIEQCMFLICEPNTRKKRQQNKQTHCGPHRIPYRYEP